MNYFSIYGDESRLTQVKPSGNNLESKHGAMNDIREDLTIHGKITSIENIDFMEYLDDVTYFVSLNTKDNTDPPLGNFIDTNELINEVEQNKAPPSAHIINSSTEKSSENSYLQIPQQRSDDPRRGGKVNIKGRGTWNKDSNVEAELDEAMIVSAIVLSLQIQEKGGILRQDLQGTAAEGNSCGSIVGNIYVNTDDLTPEDNVDKIEHETNSC